MADNDAILSRIAEALLVDYSSVYYVNAVTNEYQWYSIDPEFCSLQIEQNGKDFFQNLVRDVDKVVYEEDKHLMLTEMSKDRLLSEMNSGRMQSFEYRLMIDGKPVYHRLRLIRGVSANDDYFIFGVLNVDKEVRERQEAEVVKYEREIFNELALGMAEHYDSLYYIDMETDHYIEFSPRGTYRKMNIPPVGDDFFRESKKNVDRYVHPDDLDQVEALWRKDVLLKNLKDNTTHTATYRLIIKGEVMHCRRFDTWASDHRHVIMSVENINDEFSREADLRQTLEANVTYSQIAERLAMRYDMIYYVNAETEEFISFSSTNISQAVMGSDMGANFFERVKKDIDYAVFPDDQKKLHGFFHKEKLLDGLRFPAVRQIEYRLLSKNEPLHFRLSAMYTQDERHLLFCVENIDEELSEQHAANDPHVDPLTHAKNKDAYREQEKALQANIDISTPVSFALVTCNINDLDGINHMLGYESGDECIKEAAALLGEVFPNSPVFRMVSDEFIVLLEGQDYEYRDELFATLRKRVLNNLHANASPVLASGMAEYDPQTDQQVSDVLERADAMMCTYKKKMKAGLVE